MRSAYRRALELEKQLEDLPPQELEARLQLMGEIARQRQIAQKCAADAANYVHPKLANISHGSDPDHPLIISDAERAEAVLALLAKAGSTCIEHRPADEPRRPQQSSSGNPIIVAWMECWHKESPARKGGKCGARTKIGQPCRSQAAPKRLSIARRRKR